MDTETLATITEHDGDNVASFHEWWGVRTKVPQRRQLIGSMLRGTGSGITGVASNSGDDELDTNQHNQVINR